MARTKSNSSAASTESFIRDMGLKPEDWTVSIRFTKGVLSGGRGVVVEVVHNPSGRKKKLSRRATTKAAARTTAAELLQEALSSLRGP